VEVVSTVLSFLRRNIQGEGELLMEVAPPAGYSGGGVDAARFFCGGIYREKENY